MKTAHDYNWTETRDQNAFLALEDGSVFRGFSIGAPEDRVGEAVFNTGMTGYQEILSDPSYAGQFVCLTAPEIGNYGINPEDMESRGFFASGLIVHRVSPPSNWRSREDVRAALAARGTPAIAGIDTRALTTILRDRGAMKSYLCVSGGVSEADAIEKARAWEGLTGQDYVSRVTCKETYRWDADNRLTVSFPHDGEILPPADSWVVAYDFGIKWNILRSLRRAGLAVTVVPATTKADDVLAMKPDGVFLSNGPADPAAVGYAAEAIRGLLDKLPLMGICLGHQLLGIALGGETYKLPFGHHGCNHPVKDEAHNRTLITSQNHNYALRAESLSDKTVEITHRSLNDGSVEGLRSREYPAFSVQFHPEAAPGPHDADPLFEAFHKLIRESK
ncbi:MAG: glutamine-hydrolyzing carbamoyl-phosphate synthase small subunit [Planctomycetaceae bacterium]|nr:glutamine-hydrolyzing carbamoyl-phosphate synthase small subunit [Planctomycetaceae bacterium]